MWQDPENRTRPAGAVPTPVHTLDPAEIDRLIRKGRRLRSLAFHQLLGRIAANTEDRCCPQPA
ncbi:MAG: hypothetical protein R3C97_15075 [Geminicoccaceae bacterium]